MSAGGVLDGIGRGVADGEGLGRALDEVLANRATRVLALGEPTHGVTAFPLLRNDMLEQLVERGFRSVALEIDLFAAESVDDYVRGTAADLDEVLENGFSHGFGRIPGNRELVEWLKEYNMDRSEQERIRFHGFDAPTETGTAPSPRRALRTVRDFLPAGLRPESTAELAGLLGADEEWSNPAAMYDPGASIGNSARVRALRIVADDLASALRRAAPELSSADPAGFARAETNARAAKGLLRYHVAMARTAPDRVGMLMSLRTEMMADNLLAIAAEEQHRGSTLVFAHNAHLQRGQSTLSFGEHEATWASAGSLVALSLGDGYLFVATDGSPSGAAGTLQGAMASATDRRTLFPAAELRSALPADIATDEPVARGHIPLKASDLDAADAVVFITDTDGKQHQYW
ncbi:MAG TPA: erythromycin esterase family protein [Kutzneria sp.]|nr:erythromycin esterase family protein [Kutzneria sp.]